MQANGIHNSKEAVYEVNGHKITIALDSAKDLRRVFSLQVNKQKHEFDGYLLLEPDEPRIDSRGAIHMGAWSLTTENDELILAQRAPAPSGARVFYRLLAQVRRSPEGVWSVEPIAVQRVFR
jgi:hypothetical protein